MKALKYLTQFCRGGVLPPLCGDEDFSRLRKARIYVGLKFLSALGYYNGV